MHSFRMPLVGFSMSASSMLERNEFRSSIENVALLLHRLNVLCYSHAAFIAIMLENAQLQAYATVAGVVISVFIN